MTGHWVGMIGGDYYGKGVGRSRDTFFDDPEWKLDADWRVTNPIFIDYWKKGGLVTLCLHALNPQTGNSSWMRRHGDTYVDMVGLDSYKRTPAEIRNHGYRILSTLGKPFGLTEFGPDKLSNWDDNPRKDYDYEAFVQGVVQHLPSCTFFCVWHQYYGLQFQQNAKQCLDHPWIVNRKDLPAFGRPGQIR